MWFACARACKVNAPNILVGLLICVVLLGQFGMQMNAVSSVPRIHNISTDTLDPPSFDALIAVREAAKALTPWHTMPRYWPSNSKRPIRG